MSVAIHDDMSSIIISFCLPLYLLLSVALFLFLYNNYVNSHHQLLCFFISVIIVVEKETDTELFKDQQTSHICNIRINKERYKSRIMIIVRRSSSWVNYCHSIELSITWQWPRNTSLLAKSIGLITVNSHAKEEGIDHQ